MTTFLEDYFTMYLMLVMTVIVSVLCMSEYVKVCVKTPVISPLVP